jgi:uncharacterized protein YndB with AHSA1/START domain
MPDIRAQLFFKRPVPVVYRAWLEPVLLSQWLSAWAEVEPRVGGAYELYWNPDDPDSNSTKGCRLFGLEPNRRLAFDWKGPDHLREVMNRGKLTKVELRFDALETGSRLDFLHFGFGEGPEWKCALDWQRDAWREAFGRLQDLLA